MTTICLDTDIRKELEQLADKFRDKQLGDIEQVLSACFGFIPSEDFEEIYLYAKREEMKAEAFKDVMTTLLKYINFLAEDTNVMASSRLVMTTYEDTFKSAIDRFEKLACDLKKLESTSSNYS